MENETKVRVASDLDIIAAREKGRVLAAELGFPAADLTVVATAISELSRNILLYATVGEILMRPIQEGEREGLLIVASDEGPGIADVRRALQDGYSTSGSLGLGLPGTRRLMDEFEIVSGDGCGTKVSVKKWLR